MIKASTALVVMILGLQAAPAFARTDRWSADTSGEQAAVTDCSDCGDDVGVLVSCQGAGKTAKLSVPFLALEAEPDTARETASLSFTVGSDSFELPASFDAWGMVGFVPVAALARSSDIAKAIRRGHAMAVELDGKKIEFSLKGSASALAAFEERCGWGDD